ncbi:SPOR domain-containing protein [Streptomyces sp. V4-01]|uniref:SPOR domain-containing protein n=1 Tax=Actinacidiphila polyblastidii TaxID=3110430 RepID=A0ABU7PCB6_9ACTN|nr:SPOR domain-containing protein [Streptomyces sp. V4-01]
MLIRQDAGGNRYRVGRYATKAEAERVAQSLGDAGAQEVYVIERAAPRAAQT